MRYVKFSTLGQAEEYRAKLQQSHDDSQALHPDRPRIIDVICPTPDGQYALTWQDEDVTAEEAALLPVMLVKGKVVPRPIAPAVARGVLVASLEAAPVKDPVKDPVKEPIEQPIDGKPPVEELLP